MKIFFAVFITVTLFFFSCQQAGQMKADTTTQNASAEKEIASSNYGADFKAVSDSIGTADPAPPGQPQQTDKKKQPSQQQAAAPNPEWDKKIIKTASLQLEVKDFNAYYTSLREKIRSAGGYVAEEQQTASEYKKENSITIKVPVDQFDNAITLFTEGVQKIDERKITSQDVTAEYVDTRSRMEAKKHVRDRYTDLLKQAKNMEEILNVQGEINGIQEEIEAAAGRIQYLGHSASFSTIHLTYYQVLNAIAKNKEDEKPSFGTKLSSAFKTGGNWMLDLLLGLVSIWPLFLFLFIGFVIFKRMKVQKPKA
jgi:hypothetical protein